MLFCFLFSVFCFRASGQTPSINWRTVDGGGGASTGGVFRVTGTAGQPDAGRMSGGSVAVSGGFFASSVTVPKFTISGSMELQVFAGTNRVVRFVASAVTTNGATVTTNYLQTTDVTLTFNGGATAAYNIQAPATATHISAKTAWHLRRRQAVTFTSGAATVNFTGDTSRLKGGDLITVNVPPGTIVDTDNAVASPDYLLLLNNYLQPVGGDAGIGRADIDGDGAVTSSDYLMLLNNYLTSGDAQ